MLDKKKSVAVKTAAERRMTQPQVSKTGNTAGSHAAATPIGATTFGAAARAAPIDGAPSSNGQLESFEAGIRFFHARQLKEAREQFVEAAAGPERDVAERARAHIV